MKVPAIAYGGPDVDPSEPSPESTKLAESYVLLEFIADLASTTSKPLLPTSPVARARARFFAETVISKFTPAFYAALTRGEDPAVLLPAFDSIVELLPKKGGFAVGDQWSIGDAAVVPFIARALVVLERDIDAYKEGQGRKVREILDTDAKYERFRRYYQDNSERPSFKKTWDEVRRWCDRSLPDILTKMIHNLSLECNCRSVWQAIWESSKGGECFVVRSGEEAATRVAIPPIDGHSTKC